MHVAFLLFESIFCFLAAILCALKNSRDKKSGVTVTILNVMAGLLLFFDFFAYVFDGREGAFCNFMEKASNLAVFLLCDLFLGGVVVYTGIVLFGKFSVRRGHPTRIRNILVLMISVIGMILVVVSQFTNLYYAIDESNNYKRGEYFPLSGFIAIIGMCFIFSILIQYRKRITMNRFLALFSYFLLPILGAFFQFFFYGFAYMDIGIALSVNIMFIENMVHQNQQIGIAARTDLRTGIANENSCIEWLCGLTGKPEIMKYAAIVFDIQRFSSINRKYGVDTGTRVLTSYSETIIEELQEDEILGRQHGDQFIAIVHKANLPKILSKIAQIRIRFTDDTGKEIEEVISARAGVYEIDKIDIPAEDVISYASTALEHTRRVSGHPVTYMTKELMEEIEEQKRFEQTIRKGLENGEFEPYYQPKVNIRTNTLCGAEALARWNHDGELIYPSAFIHVMERNDSICDLDMLMLRKICNDIAKWKEEGLDIPPISINFSRRNLADPDLALKIDQIVTRSGVPKDLIEIEITETTDEFPISTMKSFVDDLRNRGFSTSIDDFGSANSSMAVLREISFDTVKIDKGFIDHDHSKDRAILDHIIKMAKSLGLRIVAEGVEQESQVETLRSLGAEIIQGFYYDRPLPNEEMSERLKNPTYDK